MIKKVAFLGLLVTGLLVFGVVHAEGGNERFAAGFQSSFPAYGLSGKMVLTDRITAQAILSPFGLFSSYIARGLYKIREEKMYNLYGFGMAGFFTYDICRGFVSYFGNSCTPDRGFGMGGGAGIEYDWRTWQPDLPPIFWNFEVGLQYTSLFYNYSPFTIGVGGHYRFDL